MGEGQAGPETHVTDGGDEMKVCPKCNQEYNGRPAISREDNETPICPECGMLEAVDDLILSGEKE